ncbi:MAG TPA: ATP-dependent RecD-like DNA helicase [Aggregatilineales bacterium]|nr:ATP-dependent RecD-like DNA helicase [Aggregatilineales bacterium]
MTQEILQGVVERITYYNDESGYTVIRLRPESARQLRSGEGELLTVVGVLPELQVGESVRLSGAWMTHKEHGRQFKAESVEQTAPTTLEGLRRYLGSGLIKGVGPVTAKRIVEHFGLKTMDVLEQDAMRMADVPGVGRHRATLIADGWARQRKIKDVMLFLAGHRVSTSLAVKIYNTYQDDSISKVSSDPYRLARDITGIGFRTADLIARNLGLPPDSPERIAAGVAYALQTLNDDGHVFAPRELVIQTAAELLDVPAEQCQAAVERLLRLEQAMLESVPVEAEEGNSEPVEALYLPPMYHSERGTARRLLAMYQTRESRLRLGRTIEWPAFFKRIAAEDGTSLTDQQQEAVQAVREHNIGVLTGGPGTGKTTTLRAVIRSLEASGARYALASPTGRAAKRLGEATGRKAQTIHRLLGFSPSEGFAFNEHHTLDVDALIVDEASMIDLVLFYNVLKALAPETHLLLVGDVDQLPSVGPGDVLRDVIRSGVAHVTRLQAIFRQAGGSLIVTNAHRVNEGELPDLHNEGDDFFMFSAEEPEAVADLVVDVVLNRIPRRFELNPLDDVQVLAPMYRGQVGVQILNERLQAALNPPGSKAEQHIAGRIFRVGDKVMQTRNNYDKDVYNGDIGRLHSLDFTDQTLKVVIDGRFVEYDWAEADELVHAFAISVHRSQGSEYPAVVMPLVSQHYMMLQRNLLYTAITRARKLVVLVGTRKAVAIAVRNDRVARRYSALAWRLRRET